MSLNWKKIMLILVHGNIDYHKKEDGIFFGLNFQIEWRPINSLLSDANYLSAKTWKATINFVQMIAINRLVFIVWINWAYYEVDMCFIFHFCTKIMLLTNFNPQCISSWPCNLYFSFIYGTKYTIKKKEPFPNV